jgi:uncharacterized membrane protein
MVSRLLRHLFTPDWIARRAFPPQVLRRIGQAIARSEKSHRGEIRFAIEASLAPGHVKLNPRGRARQVFAQLGVWDTEENSGVLIYVQLVDRRIEIVADRGIARAVAQSEWDAVCRAMERAFSANRYESGALDAIGTVTAILARHFPPGAANPNELPDKPVVL